MMKTVLLAICLSMVCALSAQSSFNVKEKEIFRDADFSFHQEDYGYAMRLFEDLRMKHQKNGPLNMRLGICYLELDVYDRDAMLLLDQAYKEGEQEALFHLGKAYHRDGQLDKAEKCLVDYRALPEREKNDKHISRQERSLKFARESSARPRRVSITNVGSNVNTPYDEYVPVVNGESSEMYFTSRRPGNTGGKKDDNGEDFEDIFVSYSNGKGWTESKRLPDPINSETHDAVVALAPDGMTMLLYRPSKRMEGGDLYITEWDVEVWSKPVKWLEELNTTYQEASACFSADGNTLYFSSTRPGGQGGKDIYRIKRLPNGMWSKAKNLGPTINTPYDEDAPFLDVDGSTLYFASEGHLTMGGYDLFKSAMLGEGEWGQPENLGYPVNSFKDDIYLTTNAGGFKGYMSSERPDGEGGQDIYEVGFTDKVESMLIVRGHIHDQHGVAKSAKITVVHDETNELHGQYAADPKGKYILTLFPGVTYKLLIEAEGCMPYITTMKHEYDEFGDDVIHMPALIVSSGSK